jgi:hypothetical protein
MVSVVVRWQPGELLLLDFTSLVLGVAELQWMKAFGGFL